MSVVVGGWASSVLRHGVDKSLLKISVRYARKPRWLPIAKSKMYKNIELHYSPFHEEEEINRMTNNYTLYNRSLWAFQEQLNQEQLVASQMATKEISEEAELDRIIAETERDNAIVKSIREKQLAEKWKEIEKEIKTKKAQLDEEELKKIQAAEKEVEKQLEKLKYMIPLDKVDEEIERALAAEVDYNFAIDKGGHVFKGRTGDTAEDMSALNNPLGIQAEKMLQTSGK